MKLADAIELHAETTKSSKNNLMDAMKGEAFAYAKYKLFEAAARKNGNTKLADLFSKTADIELNEHFKEFAELYGLVGTDKQNIQNAFNGETLEVEVTYKTFADEAREANDEKVANRFDEVRKDEIKHQKAFASALKGSI